MRVVFIFTSDVSGNLSKKNRCVAPSLSTPSAHNTKGPRVKATRFVFALTAGWHSVTRTGIGR